jgi:hypothetical protein
LFTSLLPWIGISLSNSIIAQAYREIEREDKRKAEEMFCGKRACVLWR